MAVVRSGNILQIRRSINWLYNNSRYLSISILWVWNVNQGNFNSQQGRECTWRYFECSNSGTWCYTLKLGQISKNTYKRPNKILAGKPLLKMAKFSQFVCKKVKFPSLCWSIFCPFKVSSSGVIYILLYVVCNCVICVMDYVAHVGRMMYYQRRYTSWYEILHLI